MRGPISAADFRRGTLVESQRLATPVRHSGQSSQQQTAAEGIPVIGDGLRQGLSTTLNFVLLGVIVLKFVVLIDAAFRRDDAYRAAGKMTKGGWLIILTVALAADLLIGGITSILTIAGVVAAIVYWVDVRPALKQVSGKGKGRKNQNMGPYGPW
jgi:hypothetical protein